MVTSAYIHIPFCKQKCKYCSFVSFTNTEKIPGYIYSLLKDIDSNYQGQELKTLYLGGGTPSLIEEKYLEKIIKKFRLSSDCEITIELNPDDASLEYLKSLRNIGINRLSIGSQTFDDNVLTLIGRRHNSEQIVNVVEFAKKAGFSNISIDLIYGLPEVDIKKDLEIIKDLKIQHISTYGLKIEEGSYFYNNKPDNLPNDDEQADMYLYINSFLENLGYNRYEISNFALSGFESRHNLNYWNNNEYYGFGIAAHGYLDGVRYNNYTNFEKYLLNPVQHEKGHFVTDSENLEEEIFLGLRKTGGIYLEKINKKFGINFEEKYKTVLEKFSPRFIKKTTSGYCLTIEGVLLSNNIMSEFLE